MISKAKVLITGISGYIGSHVANEFLKEGYQVRGTVRDIKNTSKYEFVNQFPNKENLEIYQLNLENQSEIENAVKGCEYIAHVASPVIMNSKVLEKDLINPTVEGCLYLLHAAVKYNIKAVVVTGSIVANACKKVLSEDKNDHRAIRIDDNDWSNEEGIKLFGAYAKSKTLEEQKAWEYYKTIDPSKRFRLSFINPSLTCGPFFNDQHSSSSAIFIKILNGEIPKIPNITLNCVDVRDVAKAHRLAIEIPEADGKRFICSGEGLHFREICDFLRVIYPELRIPTANANYYLIYLLSFIIPDLKFVINVWGWKIELKNNLIQETLKFHFKPVKKAIEEMADCIVKMLKINTHKKAIAI